MAKERFNEVERWLLQNWAKAHLLEKSMDSVRERYAELCTVVVESVQEKHPELDWSRVYVQRESGKGGIAIGRKAWSADRGWPVGFYIEGLRLELLSSEKAGGPWAEIWTQPAARHQLNPANIVRAVCVEAPRLLAKEELGRCAKDKQFWYYLPETGQQLIDALLDGDGQPFVDHLTAHFDLLARFTPLLDKLLAKPTRAK